MSKPKMTDVEIDKITMRLRNRETGAMSDEVDIGDVIFIQHDIEFNFDDDTTLPYSDFLWSSDCFDVIVKTYNLVYGEDE